MAISVAKDANRIPTLLATQNTDGVTVVAVRINPTGNRLMNLDAATGTTSAFTNFQKDANRYAVIGGVSSADGTTILPIYCDSSGNLLTKSS